VTLHGSLLNLRNQTDATLPKPATWLALVSLRASRVWAESCGAFAASINRQEEH
jgi:hypothetical protein